MVFTDIDKPVMCQSILHTTPTYHRLQGCPTIILQEEIVAYLLFNFEVRRRGDGAVAAAATPRTAAAIQRLRQVDVPVVPILLPDLNNVQVLFSFHVPSPHVLLSSPLLSRSTLHGQLTPPLAPAPESPMSHLPCLLVFRRRRSLLRAFGGRHWLTEAAGLSAKIGETVMRRANGRCGATTFHRGGENALEWKCFRE